jgi:hypothetical protein
VNPFTRFAGIAIAAVLVIMVFSAVANAPRSTDAAYASILVNDANSAASMILASGSIPPLNRSWSVADPVLQNQYNAAPTLTVTSYHAGPPTTLTIVAKVGKISQTVTFGQ